MLIKFLNNHKNTLSKDVFNMTMQMVSDDIKFNNIKFGKRTSPKDFVLLFNSSLQTAERCF